jgi:hypothetical protein
MSKSLKSLLLRVLPLALLLSLVSIKFPASMAYFQTNPKDGGLIYEELKNLNCVDVVKSWCKNLSKVSIDEGGLYVMYTNMVFDPRNIEKALDLCKTAQDLLTHPNGSHPRVSVMAKNDLLVYSFKDSCQRVEELTNLSNPPQRWFFVDSTGSRKTIVESSYTKFINGVPEKIRYIDSLHSSKASCAPLLKVFKEGDLISNSRSFTYRTRREYDAYKARSYDKLKKLGCKLSY